MLQTDSRSGISLVYSYTTMYYNSEWNKMLLLLWKNTRILLNVWKSLALTGISPLFFYIILIMLRNTNRGMIASPNITFEALDLSKYWMDLNEKLAERKTIMSEKVSGFSYNPFIPQPVIGYAPDSIAYNLIMESSKPHLQPMTVQKFYNCKLLEEAILKQSLFCGICFKHWHGYFPWRLEQDASRTRMMDIYPRHILLQIMFPNAIRLYNDTYIGNTWDTQTLHSTNFPNLPRNPTMPDGGFAGYIREGFIYVQSVVTNSYLERVSAFSDIKIPIPQVDIQRFPQAAHIRDNLHEVIDFTFSFMVVLSHYYPVLYLIAHIVEDKHHKRDIYTKVFEVHNYLHNFSWITKACWVHMFAAVSAVILLKIRWNNDLAIFNKSKFQYLLLVFVVYNLATISFCIMMSSIFTYTITSVVASSVIWFLSYAPYFSQVCLYDEGLDNLDNFFLMIFHNTALGYLFDGIIIYELYASEMSISDFLSVVHLDNPLTTGKCILIMLIQAVAYLIVALCIEEGRIIYGKICDFLHNGKIVSDLEKNLREGFTVHSVKHESFIHEILGRSTTVVNIQRLSKVYEQEIVVKNVNLELYENQITILIGHNGCGKTTLLRMLCGLIEPTTGTIIMDGFNLKKDRKFACASLGVCFADSLLYANLTAEDQLRFFSYLKGLDVESIESEVEKYLNACNLIHKRDVVTKDLSLGSRYELAICCALTGQSRIVLIDEPYALMDDASRLRNWELLLREKQGRSILIAANCIDILKVLGDRVAIMSKGELQCVGTPSFLKKMYGRGYRLTCIKRPDCDSKLVHELIQKHIPQCTPITDVGYSISYNFNEKYFGLFSDLIKDLQSNLYKLALLKVTIRPLCLKDIYMKMGTRNPAFENYAQLAAILRGESIHKGENENLHFMKIKERVTGWKRVKQQISALFIIKHKFVIYYKFNVLTKMFTVPAFIIIAFYSSAYYISYAPLVTMQYTIDKYSTSFTIMENKSADNTNAALFSKTYGESIYWYGYKHTLLYTGNQTFTEFIMSISRYDLVKNDYVVGITFLPNKIKCWFNNYYLHSLPLAVNLAYKSIQRVILGEYSSTKVTIQPIYAITVKEDALERNASSFAVTFSIYLAMGTSFLTTSVVFSIIRSRNCGLFDLEKLTGLKRKTYWLATIAIDTLYLLFLAFTFIAAMAMCAFSTHITIESIAWYTVAYIIVGVSIYSFNYMLSQFIENSINGYVICTTIAAFSMICFVHCYQGVQNEYMDTPKMLTSRYFLLMPHFVLSNVIVTIYCNMEFKRVCLNHHIFEISVYLEECKTRPNCCKTYNILDVKDGILLELLASVLNMVFCWSIIIMKERNYFQHFWKPAKDDFYAALQDHIRRHESEDTDHYQSVHLESLKVKGVGPKRADYTLICDCVGKTYKNVIGIDRFSLLMEKGSTLGLISSNNSGKTTLLKLIAGLTTLSYGRVYINGYNTLHHINRAMQYIGYGFQDPVPFYEITVKDVMNYMCSIHAYPYHMIDAVCVNLAKAIGFYKCYNKHLDTLSTGTSKMLVCALALLDNRPLILLDSLTADIDASAHLRIWNILNRMIQNGSCVIFSSNYLSILEKFADRVCVITCGCCRTLAPPSNLDSFYLYYNLIRIKLNSNIFENQNDSSGQYMQQSIVKKLYKFINTEFPQSVATTQIGHFFEFLIPINQTSTLGLLKKIEKNQYYLNIEDFEILRNTFYSTIATFISSEGDCNRP